MGNIQEEMEVVSKIEAQLKEIEKEVNPPLPRQEKKRKFIEENTGLLFILGIVVLALAAHFVNMW